MTDMFSYYKSLVVGSDLEVPVSGGKMLKYVNFDNAASTPAFRSTMEAVNKFMSLYSNVHRGSGFKSLISTEAYEKSREIIAEFLGTNLLTNNVIFVKNSTEAINRVANLFDFSKDDIVITSAMEHHSNDLPWRKNAQVQYIRVDNDGVLDIEHFNELINLYKGNIKLIAVTGASNVTGHINPIHFMAKEAHKIGAKILIDASQLLPHKKLDMKDDEHEEHIDFVVFTAHKLYAPFGTGVLIGPRVFFDTREPDFVGGGTVQIVTEKEAFWNEAPERFEAGTPNVVGAVALASAIRQIQAVGVENINKKEQLLFNYLMKRITDIENIKMYGGRNSNLENRLSVLSFNIEDIHHSILSAVLSYEYAIGVRSGCFCAHPYVLKLLGIDTDKINSYRQLALNGNKLRLPGLVRVSLGLYNDYDDIDRLIYALKNISKGKVKENYIIDRNTASLRPENWSFHYENYFNL